MFDYNTLIKKQILCSSTKTYAPTSIAQWSHWVIYMRAPRIHNKEKRISKYLPCWTAIHRIVLREIKTGLLFRDHRKYKILRKSILFISRHTECVTGDYETRWVMAYQLQHIIFRKPQSVWVLSENKPKALRSIISKQTQCVRSVWVLSEKHT